MKEIIFHVNKRWIKSLDIIAIILDFMNIFCMFFSYRKWWQTLLVRFTCKLFLLCSFPKHISLNVLERIFFCFKYDKSTFVIGSHSGPRYSVMELWYIGPCESLSPFSVLFFHGNVKLTLNSRSPKS